MPWTVDDALRLAMKRHTVEEAQRRLQQQKHGGDGKAVGAVDSEETEDTKPTWRYCDEQGTLFQQVRHLEEAVAQLQVRTGKRRIVCWQCGEGGHIKRDCTKKKPTRTGPRNRPDILHLCLNP